jgi:hypothetical protein
MLLEKGADVNAKDNDGWTALHGASYNGHSEIVRMLLAQKGIEVNAKSYGGWTALHWASFYGHPETVAMLLEKGADVTAKNRSGNTARSVGSGNLKTLKPEIIAMLEEAMLPNCMSQTEYEKCIPGWDEEWDDPENEATKPEGWPWKKKPICGISHENIESKEDAVKLPGQPKTCYDRKLLNEWFNIRKTNPLDRSEVEQTWIDANMGPCKPALETVFNDPSKGGKRRSKK